MTYGAVRGVLASLGDPYSAFLESAQHRSDSHRLEGEFEGIGLELPLPEGSIVVTLVYPNSPAKTETAGVLIGDIVMSANEMSTVGHADHGIGLLPDVVLAPGNGQQHDVVLQTARSDLRSWLGQSTTSTLRALLCRRDGVREE